MIYIKIILPIILIILFGLSKHERDTCRTNFKKTLAWKLFPNWVYDNIDYVTKNLWRQEWWIKNVLTWKIDYWHAAEVVNVYSTSLMFTLLLNGFNWWSLLISIGIYITIGGVHSALDSSLFRRKE